MPTHDEDNLDPLAALLERADQNRLTSSDSDTPPLPHHVPNNSWALWALHSMQSAGRDVPGYVGYRSWWLKDEHGLKPGMKTGRKRYQEQHGSGTMTVAQLTHKILTLEWEQRLEEELRDKSQRRYGNPDMYDHDRYRLEHVIREIATLKRELLSRLNREQEAEEAEILKGMAELETEVFGQLPPPPAEPPPGEILTETIVIAPGAPGRN